MAAVEFSRQGMVKMSNIAAPPPELTAHRCPYVVIDLNTPYECRSLKVRWSVELASKGSGCSGSGGRKSVVVVVVVRTRSGHVRSPRAMRVKEQWTITNDMKVEDERRDTRSKVETRGRESKGNVADQGVAVRIAQAVGSRSKWREN